MDIALAFDEGYATHAQVVMESVLRSHPERGDITFWTLAPAAVLAERAEAFDRQVAGRARLRPLDADEAFRSLPTTKERAHTYVSAATYLRLLLPDRLPPAMERILYLDCDVLVQGDLAPLWELPLGDAPLAAVRDGFTRRLRDNGGLPGLPAGMDPNAPYFNAGVLLIHLPVWRAMDITGRCTAYLTAHRERLRFNDQDALNVAAYGCWLRMDPIWNDTFIWRQPPTAQAYLEPERVRVAHFIGPYKPWHADFPHDLYRQQYLGLVAGLSAATNGG